MSKQVASLVFILAGIACGGTTDIGDESDGGASSGGNGHAGSGGSASGGASDSAGKATGGSVSAGGSDAGGTIGVGGTIIVVGGFAGTETGGSAAVDPRCPDYLPQSPAVCEDAGLSCEYDFTGCLCYPLGSSYGFCQKVDPTCTGAPVPAAAPPPEAGTGGFTTKVALPPRRVCTCSAEMWACNYGF
jgi:hypothetical protein